MRSKFLILSNKPFAKRKPKASVLLPKFDLLLQKVLEGDVRGTARFCRYVDERVEGYRDLLKQVFKHTKGAWVIGVTGSPGVGKSSITNGLIANFRKQGKRVAVIAVDPSSPFSGGAILGDRIRMQHHFEDREVFIRSVATRGALGGLSRSVFDLLFVLDAWGAEVILVETVGVGQDEIEITQTAHSTLVVMAPGLGDDVQAIKAGIMECADVFAVNKADRDGADSVVRDIELMIALGGEVKHAGGHSKGHAPGLLDLHDQVIEHNQHWLPTISRTVATKQQGLEELVHHLEKHHRWIQETSEGQLRKKQRLEASLRLRLRDYITDQMSEKMKPILDQWFEQVVRKEKDPYSLMEEVVGKWEILKCCS